MTNKPSKKITIASMIGIGVLVIAGLSFSNCLSEETNEHNGFIFMPLLSFYHIYSGKPIDMVPEKDFHIYQLATTLFTDYAHKQRLIRLPVATKMIQKGSDLPEFPDSTFLVKTFFYYADERDTSKGKRMIETRLMIKSGKNWHMGTYVWNARQTEAGYQKDGSNIPVEWINSAGEIKAIIYRVPCVSECGTCHRQAKAIVPLGPKLRNMNFDVDNGGRTENQLSFFQANGLLDAFDPHDIASLPQAFNRKISIAEQARAYMEMNCAHCHNPNGYCKGTGLYLQYSLPIGQTNILRDKNRIINKTSSGRMPLMGKTINHTEGQNLIRTYINNLK